MSLGPSLGFRLSGFRVGSIGLGFELNGVTRRFRANPKDNRYTEPYLGTYGACYSVRNIEVYFGKNFPEPYKPRSRA